MSKQICFDSTDWNSIQDTINKVNEIGCPQLGLTEYGEDIMFTAFKDADGYDVLHTTVLQTNGWERHNFYYTNDYIKEEMYRRVCADE